MPCLGRRGRFGGQRRGWRGCCSLGEFLCFLVFTCSAFVGLLTRQEILLVRLTRGIAIEECAVRFHDFGESIDRGSLEKQLKLTTRIVPELVAVLEHPHEQQRSLTFFSWIAVVPATIYWESNGHIPIEAVWNRRFRYRPYPRSRLGTAEDFEMGAVAP